MLFNSADKSIALCVLRKLRYMEKLWISQFVGAPQG